MPNTRLSAPAANRIPRCSRTTRSAAYTDGTASIAVISVIPAIVPTPKMNRYASAYAVSGIAASTSSAAAAEPARPCTMPITRGRIPLNRAGTSCECGAAGPAGRRLLNPSMISINATPNSSARPTRGGIAMRNTTSAPPTRNTVSEWPMPQSPPIHAARRKLRSRETIVVMATTWSASVACLSPSRKPSTAAESTLRPTGIRRRSASCASGSP